MNQQEVLNFFRELFHGTGFNQEDHRLIDFGRCNADPFVIEISCEGKPYKFSLKFNARGNSCCINVRPATKNFGQNNQEKTQEFIKWINNKYPNFSVAGGNSPYFKPYQRIHPNNGNLTSDIFFPVKGANAFEKVQIHRCPHFPHLNNDPEEGGSLIMNITEAVNSILKK